jgi:hypothetical protein
MSAACGAYGGKEKYRKVLVGKPERRLRTSTRMERRGMDSSSSGQGEVAVINLLVPSISGIS